MEILFSFIGSLPVLLLLGYIWATQVKRVEKLEDRANEIEDNYLDRFEKVNEHLSDIKQDVATLIERSKK